ncbi:MAG: SH3 domain-containing protein [Jaaginema sp. PMC 1080.18]|nr:SH3 domain-containing protein [Jaaginema sp. PMC 1080.18]
MSHKSTQFAALWGAVLSITLCQDAIAQLSQPPTLAQSMMGECRVLNHSAFLYTTRSRENPVQALSENTRVLLEENGQNDGWIAVRAIPSDNLGFVETRYLALCNNAPGMDSPQPIPQTGISKPIPPTAVETPSSCRRVIYRDPEGVAIRSAPNVNATWVGSLSFNDRVTIDPRQIRRIGEREWVKLTAPIEGWMSNGFPGEASNLGVCL